MEEEGHREGEDIVMHMEGIISNNELHKTTIEIIEVLIIQTHLHKVTMEEEGHREGEDMVMHMEGIISNNHKIIAMEI